MKKTHERASQGEKSTRANLEQSFSPSTAKLIEKFDSLIGLTQAKEKVREIIAIAEVNQKKKKLNLGITNISQHMIFSGNPGTGKTTIARRLGEIFKEIGILSKGHFVEVQRSDLVAGYLGQTAIKTSEKVQEALGGILFIDEAYSLSSENSNDQFGREAINTLVAAMENHRNNLVVIAAGYPEEMKTFVNSNPGLDSRFSTTVHFEDYTDSELIEIFKRMTIESGLQLGEGGEPILEEIIDLIGSNRGKGFGNARDVRKVFERVVAIQNQRLVGINAGTNELQLILPEDLLATKSKMFPSADCDLTSIDRELNELIGLSRVKQEIKRLIDVSRINAERKKNGLNIVQTSLHMVFTGNPGTGKTTVARLVSRYLFEIGCLSRNNLVEVSRADLVAGFVGQTAIKTQNKLEFAKGGVLFIDEAYTLYDSSDRHNFGKESLETILRFMEDHKENIVVILAGYKTEMDILLDSNPGLKSRFNRFINFDDYEARELVQVFKKIAESSDYTTAKGFDEGLLTSVERLLLQKNESFGNGRAMRNLFEKVIERQASRLALSGDLSRSELKELTVHDLSENDLL
jgi:SpoVK/Ycf46/Vps4 family AAA+-type ATPase